MEYTRKRSRIQQAFLLIWFTGLALSGYNTGSAQAEGRRESVVKIAEGEKQARILQAEGESVLLDGFQLIFCENRFEIQADLLVRLCAEQKRRQELPFQTGAARLGEIPVVNQIAPDGRPVIRLVFNQFGQGQPGKIRGCAVIGVFVVWMGEDDYVRTELIYYTASRVPMSAARLI